MLRQLAKQSRIAVLLGVLTFTLSATAAVTNTQDDWEIDTTHSNVGFEIRHFFSNVPGSFREFDGKIKFDVKKPEQGEVEVTIKAASIDTNNKDRDNHLRNSDFFDVKKYPEIKFVSKKITHKKGNDYEIAGDITMHGITHPITLNAKYLGEAKDPWGFYRAGFSATATLDRKKFGINWNKTLDNGGTILSDDVKIVINIEAKRSAGETKEKGSKK